MDGRSGDGKADDWKPWHFGVLGLCLFAVLYICVLHPLIAFLK